MAGLSLGKRALALLFVLSLAVRLAGVWYMNGHLAWNLVAPDTRGSYRPIALNLASGQGYQVEGNYRRATAIAPAFPLFLAAVYKLGGPDSSTVLFGVLNAIMRAVVTVLVALMAAHAFGRATGIAAGLLQALDPWEAFWGAFVLKESLAVFGFVVAVWLVWRMRETGRVGYAIAAGAAIGAAGLTRYPNLGFAGWVLLILAWSWWRERPERHAAVRQAAGIAFGVALILSPWLVRNYQVYGELLVTEPWAGRYLYTSNGPGTEGTFETWGYSGLAVGDLSRLPPAVWDTPTARGRDLAYLRAVIGHVAANPGQTVRVALARFVNMWRPTFAGASRSNVLALGVPYVLLLFLALAGMVAVVRAARESPRGADPPGSSSHGRTVLWWTIAYFLVLHGLFWSEIRYRQYAMPFVTVLAGVGLVAFLKTVWRTTD